MESVRIAFLFTSGRKNRIEQVEEKKSPSEFFYGALELKKLGYAVSLLEYADFGFEETPSYRTRVVRKIFSLFGKRDWLFQALNRSSSLELLNSFSVVIATTNWYGSVLSRLAAQGKLRAKILFLPMGVLDINAKEKEAEKIRVELAQCINALISKEELSFLQQKFPSIARTMHYLPFGVDTTFWSASNTKSSERYVLSIGNDKHRDYETLVRAWKPDYPTLKIITKLPITTAIPANVQVLRGDWKNQVFSDIDIRNIMSGALFGIIPLKQTIQPAGQSACLQIMACGRPVVISKIAGLWDVEAMSHGKTCLLPLPASTSELQKNIELLLSDSAKREMLASAAKKVVDEKFTTVAMANALAAILEKYV